MVNALDASGHDTSRFDREFRPELGKEKKNKQVFPSRRAFLIIIGHAKTITVT